MELCGIIETCNYHEIACIISLLTFIIWLCFHYTWLVGRPNISQIFLHSVSLIFNKFILSLLGKKMIWEKLLLYGCIILSQPNLSWEHIQIPHNPGPPCQINKTDYEWAWAVKQILISTRGFQGPQRVSDRMGSGNFDCKNQQLKLSNGETVCWKVRSYLDKLETAPLKCSHIINWTMGAAEPKKTWYISELRTFICDMCTCLGYPNYGYLNWDTRCDGSYEKLEMVLSYDIPITHDPDQRRVGIQVKSHRKFPSLTYMSVHKSDIQLCEYGRGMFSWENVFLLEHVWYGWTLYDRASYHVS